MVKMIVGLFTIVLTLLTIFILLLLYKRQTSILTKVCLLSLVLLALAQNMYIWNYNTLKDSDEATFKNSTIQKTILPEEVLTTVKLQLQKKGIQFVNEFCSSDIKHVQIDTDDDYEIIIHNKNLEDTNFILLDYIDGKYEILLTNQNIEDYYAMSNNLYLILISKLKSFGTGVAESNYLIYKKESNSYSFLLTIVKDSIHAKVDNMKVEKRAGSINIIDDKLIYSYVDLLLIENIEILESKKQEEYHLLQ